MVLAQAREPSGPRGSGGRGERVCLDRGAAESASQCGPRGGYVSRWVGSSPSWGQGGSSGLSRPLQTWDSAARRNNRPPSCNYFPFLAAVCVRCACQRSGGPRDPGTSPQICSDALCVLRQRGFRSSHRRRPRRPVINSSTGLLCSLLPSLLKKQGIIEEDIYFHPQLESPW